MPAGDPLLQFADSPADLRARVRAHLSPAGYDLTDATYPGALTQYLRDVAQMAVLHHAVVAGVPQAGPIPSYVRLPTESLTRADLQTVLDEGTAPTLDLVPHAVAVDKLHPQDPATQPAAPPVRVGSFVAGLLWGIGLSASLVLVAGAVRGRFDRQRDQP